MKGEPLSSVLEPAVETPMVGKSVITLDDLSIRQIQEMLHKAQYIDSHRKEVAHTCEGRVLATLFYEPSTRTRLSFETAMLRLGGKVIGFAGAQLASVTKGETIADTLKTVSNYVDVVASAIRRKAPRWSHPAPPPCRSSTRATADTCIRRRRSPTWPRFNRASAVSPT